MSGSVPSEDQRVLRVFISYRRDDSPSYARELFSWLSRRFPNGQVFWDIGTIDPGLDFVEEIERAVGSCDVLIAVIGPHWLDMQDRRGQRRLDDAKDFVRLEIATALTRNIRVIPVLVQHAVAPGEEDLPEPLKHLARRNAIELSDSRWEYDLGMLISALERVQAKALKPPTGRLSGKETEGAPTPEAGAGDVRGSAWAQASSAADPWSTVKNVGAVPSPPVSPPSLVSPVAAVSEDTPRPRPSQGPSTRLIAGAAAGVLALVAIIAIAARLVSGGPTAGADPTPVAAANPATTVVSTPLATAASTPLTSAAPSPRATLAPTALPTTARESTRSPTPGPGGTLALAPISAGRSGTLTEVANSAAASDAKVNMRDFAASVQFFNPASSTTTPWDYGLTFRSDSNGEYRLYVDSSRAWYFKLVNGDQFTTVKSGRIATLDISPGGSTILNAIAINDQVLFFVNGSFVEALDVSARTTSGDVQAAAAFTAEDTAPGRTERFAGFVVTPLTLHNCAAAGPCGLSGGLVEQSGQVTLQNAHVSSSDFVAVAHFDNPGSGIQRWDVGFNLRDAGSSNLRLYVSSTGNWSLDALTPSSSTPRRIDQGTGLDMDTRPDGFNDLRLIVSGSSALLVLNDSGTFAQMTLPAQPASGDVSVGTGFDEADVTPGSSISFSGFVVATP